MRAILARLFRPNLRRQHADALYLAVSHAARRPLFYARLGVADTLDGRFDMMALIGSLVFRAVGRKGQDGERLAQDATNAMFAGFDDAIRALGVGDSGLKRRIKEMGKAYVGRGAAYDAALKSDEKNELSEALIRNLYRGISPDEAIVSAMARFMRAEAMALDALPLERFQSGDLGVRPVPGFDEDET